MQTLKVVAASLFLLHAWALPQAHAGSMPPSKIILHGVYTDGCELTIDPDGVVVLEEAVRLLKAAPSGVVFVVDGAQSRADPTRLQREAELASVYLAQHGVDPAHLRVEAADGVTPIALCAFQEPVCPVC